MGEDWTGAFPVEDALEMVLMFDGTGEITYANAAARSRLGYAPEGAEDGLRGRQMGEVFPGVFRFPGSVSGIPEGEERPHLVMYRRNRTCFPVEARFLRNPDRGIFVCMANDILEQEHLGREIEQVREEARQAARVKSEFVANVTHELRTPVNGIKGHVTSLLDAGVAKEQKRTLDIIARCCDNMSAIINNILDFSKLEAGKFTIEQKEFNVYEMVSHTVETNITAIDAKGLHIMVNMDKGIPEYLIGDELRLTQILNNLLSNAVKFTSVGYISIEVTKTLQFDDEVELFFVVSDTGIGISQEEKDKLFKSFSQVDASITRKYGGTGLGLAITKQLVELMHGNIHLDSEKGKGSSFSFSVRLHQAQGKGTEGKGHEMLEYLNRSQGLAGNGSLEEIFQFGTPENGEEIRSKMEKLILCMEVGAWDKAEAFTHNLKSLVGQGPKDMKRTAFRLEMNVRKEDLSKSMEQYNNLKSLLEGQLGIVFE